MIVTPEEVAQHARSLVGTPYRHQGRVVGPLGGLDCCGVVVMTGRRCGFEVADDPTYPELCPNPDQLWKLLPLFSTRVCGDPELLRDASDCLEPGLILVFHVPASIPEMNGPWWHVGISTGGGKVVHGYNTAPRIAEVPLDGFLAKVLVEAWRFHGVAA